MYIAITFNVTGEIEVNAYRAHCLFVYCQTASLAQNSDSVTEARENLDNLGYNA
jgi:hypothetical protein